MVDHTVMFRLLVLLLETVPMVSIVAGVCYLKQTEIEFTANPHNGI